MTKQITNKTKTVAKAAAKQPAERTAKSLVAAFSRIADFLVEDGVVNRKTGEFGNKLGFTQRQLLGQMIYAIQSAIDFQVNGPRKMGPMTRNYSLTSALRALAAARRQHVVGNEVSEDLLRQREAWVADCEYNIQHLEVVLEAAKMVYLKATGEAHGTRPKAEPELVPQPVSPEQAKATANADAMLARYGMLQASRTDANTGNLGNGRDTH